MAIALAGFQCLINLETARAKGVAWEQSILIFFFIDLVNELALISEVEKDFEEEIIDLARIWELKRF